MGTHSRLLLSAAAALAVAACGGGSNDTDNTATHNGTRERAAAIASPAQAVWAAPVSLPLVPTAAAALPDGKVLLWSAEERFSFGQAVGRTYTVTFDPATNTSTERTVTESGHNMFCPGTTNLADGRLLVNGGISSGRTSIFNPATGVWTTGAAMNITRGYNANTILADGSVFTLGGSWSGGVGNKHGEVWTEAGGWRRMSGIPIDPMLSPDPSRNFGGDSHFWLIPTGHGRVLHAGPGVAMHLLDTRGNGAVQAMGARGDDQFSVSGTAVMYDIGKVLKAGGSPGYEGFDANANAYVIDTNGGAAAVRKVQAMNYARVFHNSVVLPNGQVVMIGGQTRAAAFTDDRSVLAAELFDPVTETFTVMPAMTVPRNYHGVSLLLPDARVLVSGSGLCGGCAANHPDVQILSPHYLFNANGTAATRPAISGAPTQAGHGTAMAVQTNTPVGAFSFVRMGSTTHTVNNDQRRIPLQFSITGSNSYSVQVPSNTGVALPGLYMLFAINADGVPSVARVVRVGGTGTPQLAWPGEQTGVVGAAVNVALSAPGATGYAASALPPGVVLNASSGVLSGAPSVEGTYNVTVSASNANGTVSTQLLWRVSAPGNPRYVRLEALSEVAGNPWTSMAEFNLLDDNGNTLPRTGWAASADSVELAGENGAAANAIDGNAATFWHTQWQTANPVHPHWFTVDMGATARLGGFRYLPRSGGGNGTIALYRFYVSSDGINWGSPVASGDLRTLGANAAEKTVRFTLAGANRAPTIATPAAQSGTQGVAASLALQASDADGDALTFVASGLPPGLTLSGNVIGGTPTPAASGSYTVDVTVQDARGAAANTSFVWTILAAPTVISPVSAPPAAAGSSVTYNASATGAGLEYAWTFGDGTPATAFSAASTTSHTYANQGLYTVTLSVRTADGRVTTTSFVQAITGAVTAARPAASSNIALEPRSGANARLWVVNPDNDTVSVFDAVTNAKQAEIAVGAGPRTLAVSGSGTVWVANRNGASLSVVSTGTLAVTQTIAMPRASMPYGIAFSPADGSAWVALEATGQLLRMNAGGAVTGTVAVGANARQVSISGDGARVLVSRFITPALPGEGTASVQTADRGGEVVVVNAATLALQGTTVLQHSERPDNTLQGRGVPNYLGAAVIAPDGAFAWVPSKQDNIKRGTLRDGSNLDFQNTVRAVTSRIDLGTLTENPAARIDHDNASVASAAAFHPSGAYLFVALETSRQVAVIDPVARREVMRFDAGRAPQGLVVSANGLRLYVSNFMDRSVTVHDLTRLVSFGEFTVPAPTTLASVASERLTAQVLQGKRLFYDARDPRLARDGYMSCATCHRDGDSDGRTWDLTGLGEGLRNTISLRGRAGAQGRLHWSGNFDEVQDFEAQIRSLAQGSGLMTDAQFNTGTRSQPLGDRKAGVSADLDALAAYVASLNTFDPSPRRNADGSLTADAVAGRTVFAAQCTACHGGSTFTASALNVLNNVGTIKPSSGTRLGAALTGIDPPTLRDAWQTAPYLHDGSAATIAAAIAAHNNVSLDATQLAQVAAFVAQIGSEEAAVAATGGGGLLGNYFNNVSLAGTPAWARTEAVNFNWGSGSPGAGIGSDNFSARWSGSVLAATSGSYRFRTYSDDGVRLWVNNVQVINNWTDHSPTNNTSGAVELVAGQRYAIRLEFYERGGGAVMQLRWLTPGAGAYAIVPAASLYATPP